MKNVVTIEQMRTLEDRVISSGITAEMLMEQAGDKIADYVAHYIKEHKLPKKVFLFAGKGNNGGDGYTAARKLLKHGIAVVAMQVMDSEEGSLCSKKRREFEEAQGPGKVTSEFPQHIDGIILDAIFGIGFQGQVSGNAADVIQKINALKVIRIAIDIPSGINGNLGAATSHDNALHGNALAVIAHITLTIELPKLGFFVGNGWNYVGKLVTLPIGLVKEKFATELQYLEESDVIPLLPPIKRNRHKYEAGSVVGLAGAHGMAGAAMMASWSSLRTGAGIVHLLHPAALTLELHGPPWEVVRVPFPESNLSIIREWFQKAGARFIGPGLGSSKVVEFLLKTLWDDYKDKAVLDADCLNFIAKTNHPIGPLPNSILTPHVGEMKRLLDDPSKEPISLSFLRRCHAFVETNLTHLVLKGGPSFLFSLGDPITVMPWGDPGMATAGSGDVLTGILASLLAQGLKAHDALFFGTFLHGLAGEIAAEKETSYCMTATSIINHLPEAFQRIEQMGHSLM